MSTLKNTSKACNVQTPFWDSNLLSIGKSGFFPCGLNTFQDSALLYNYQICLVILISEKKLKYLFVGKYHKVGLEMYLANVLKIFNQRKEENSMCLYRLINFQYTTNYDQCYIFDNLDD